MYLLNIHTTFKDGLYWLCGLNQTDGLFIILVNETLMTDLTLLRHIIHLYNHWSLNVCTKINGNIN